MSKRIGKIIPRGTSQLKDKPRHFFNFRKLQKTMQSFQILLFHLLGMLSILTLMTLQLFFFQVQDTSFILCIVVIQPEIPVRQLKNLNTVPSSKLLYHRLDLLGQPNACLHFKQLATLGKATLLKSITRPSVAILLAKTVVIINQNHNYSNIQVCS